MAFDPCREWLGLDAIELVDPWRVLGLNAGVGDAETITRAATARLESLGRIVPGPFAKAHAALVAKVHEARDSLLAQALLEEADHQPIAQPPPLADASIRADPPAAARPDALGGRLPPGRPRRPPASRSGNAGLFWGSLVLLAAAVVLLIGLMLGPDGIRRQVAVFRKSVLAGGLEPPAGVRKPSPIARGAAAPSPPPAAAVSRAAEPARSAPTANEATPAVAGEPRGPVAAHPAPRDSERGEPEGASGPSADDTRRQEEAEAVEAERHAEQDRIRLRQSLEKSLGEAYAAVQRGECDTADRLLAAAGNQVGDDVEGATRLEHWRLFVAYAREFTGYRDQAFEAAKAGRDYTVDGKTFALIEITPKLFIYKLAGRIERVSRERLDPRIELAVVEKWFAADGRPANHLFLGARWLSLAPPNVGRARAEWRVAGDGGEEVGGLLALIDDPVIRRVAPGATP